MRWQRYTEEDGMAFDEFELSKKRHEVLMGKKEDGTLTPVQEQELSRNKYGRYVRELEDDVRYLDMTIEHQERTKGMPKD